MNSNNYGRKATERNLKAVHAKSQKYMTRFSQMIFRLLFIFCAVVLVTGISAGFGMVKGIIDNAPEIDPNSFGPSGFATKVYDSAGNLTDTLVMEGSNREAATYEELPQDLIDAFVAIEDSRFWEHDGIDIRSIMRAAVGVLTNDNRGGGSTLTQQLIKNNVFKGGNESTFAAKLERKFQEQYLALQLEKALDPDKTKAKQKIITDYLNTINLGSNTLGVKVAARRYFDKDVSDLTLSECTVIAGITQKPTYYNPITNPENNAEKRKIILQYMRDQGYITEDEQNEALSDNVYERIQQNNNMVVANKESTMYSYFTDELTEQVQETLMKKLGYSESQAYNLLYGGGLTIYTTQDPVIQAIVDEEVNNPANYTSAKYSVEYRLSVTHANGETEHYSEENLKKYHREVLRDNYTGLYTNEESVANDIERFKAHILQEGDEIIGERMQTTLQPQTSFVLMDQATGQVKAISGGRGEKTASLTLNRATNTLRQPGSTFKVLTAFAPALDACGATLGTVYYDTPYTIGTKTFKNWYSQGKYQGYSNIRSGIIFSMNIVAVRCLVETVTPQLGIEYAQNLGITSLTSNDYNPATALGGLTHGVSNLELTAAYAAIANGGVYTEPIFFTKILDHTGKVLLDNTPETHRALKDSTAFLLTDAMADSVRPVSSFARAGAAISSTSTRARLSGMTVAGKSGTTSSNNDVWFVGYTPYYTAGIWAGCDSNQSLSNNGGTSFHKDIWRKIMDRVHEGLSDPGFAVPESVETAQICRKSGKLAVSGVCTNDPRGNAVYTEYFAKGTVPTEVCDKHIVVTVCSATGRKPTEFCPERRSRVCMALPQDEEGSTDDSAFGIPGYCNVHTGVSVILPPVNPDGSSAPAESSESIVTPLGPGYVQTNPVVIGTMPTEYGPGV